MTREPTCPQCGATGRDLRLSGKQVAGNLLGTQRPMEGYQCQKCGMAFTYNPPADQKAMASATAATRAPER